MKKTTTNRALVVGAIVTAAGSGHAFGQVAELPQSGVTLDQLIGGQFRVRDKLFTITSFSTPTQGPSFDPASFNITPFVAGNPFNGIGFDINGPIQDLVRGDAFISDFTLQYTVEIVDDPNTAIDESDPSNGYAIVDNRLNFNGTAGGEPGSLVRVVEDVFNFETGELIGQKEVFDIIRGEGDEDTQLEDFLEFDPLTKISVVKDVEAFAATDCCDATISFIRQSFSQVPSPGGVAVLGAMGFTASRRRRA